MAILYNNDLDGSALQDQRIAVLGFGAQGRAQALNLRDGGYDVVVGLREGSAHRDAAAAESLSIMTPQDAVANADIVAMLVPDTVQADVHDEVIAPHLPAGALLVFAHGFAIRYERIRPREDIDIALVAPMGIGEQVRCVFQRGAGVPGLLAIHQDASGSARQRAMAYARAQGHGHAGLIETTFAEETETDLFAEQAVLCGGMNHLIEAAFDTLVDAGYQPEVAYFCCLHEVSFIAQMMQQRGIAGMRESISEIAEYGDYTRGKRLVDDGMKQRMRDMLKEIRDGRFVHELDAERDTGHPVINAGREAARRHLLEATGARLRLGMPWLNEKNDNGEKA